MNNKTTKILLLSQSLAIIFFVGFLVTSLNKNDTKKIVTRQIPTTTTTSTTTSTIVPATIPDNRDITIKNLQYQIDQCRNGYDSAMRQIETERQIIRTYDDATMTNNPELAQIALSMPWADTYNEALNTYQTNGCY